MTIVLIKNTPNIDEVIQNVRGKYVVYESNNKFQLPIDCKGIIICGSLEHVYDNNWTSNIANILAIVQGRQCPILGICYGMQVLAYLFGGEVKKMSSNMEGKYPIIFDPKSPLFIGMETKDATFSNQDIVYRVPKGFRIISYVANTKKAIGFYNKTYNIYGTQFHPEKQNSTKIILRNFMNICLGKTVHIEMKDIIIKRLQEMSNIEKANNQPFKVRAYKKVIDQFKVYEGSIASVDDIVNFKGIGEGIKNKIIQIIENGKIDGIEVEDIEKTKVIDELLKIHGIGAVKAAELYTLGIRSIEGLEDKKELLNDKQLLGIKYYKDIEKRIPRREMDKHAIVLFSTLDSLNIKSLKYEIAGSYRRGNPDSGDIDLIISAKGLEGENLINKIVSLLKEYKYIKDDFAMGEKKYMGVCCLPRHKTTRRIDIMFTEPTQYPFALLYFTGSQKFNIGMRNIALSKGYSLNEYGLKKIGDKAIIKDEFTKEKDIFDFLEMEWVEPKSR